MTVMQWSWKDPMNTLDLKFLILELDVDSFPLGLNKLNFYLSVAS